MAPGAERRDGHRGVMRRRDAHGDDVHARVGEQPRDVMVDGERGTSRDADSSRAGSVSIAATTRRPATRVSAGRCRFSAARPHPTNPMPKPRCIRGYSGGTGRPRASPTVQFATARRDPAA